VRQGLKRLDACCKKQTKQGIKERPEEAPFLPLLLLFFTAGTKSEKPAAALKNNFKLKKTENMKTEYDLSNILIFLFKRRRAIITVTAFSAIVAIVVSLLLEEEFKSTVVIYPASTSSVSKALLTDMSRAPKDILKFGEEEETEQLMQILQSNEIKRKIIEKYDLMQHYKINPTDKYARTKLNKKYDDKIKARKTQFQAIEITVFDTDNEMAAAIANDISVLLDSTYNKILEARSLKALEIVENEYRKEQAHIRMLEDSLSILRQTGVFDYENQVIIYTEAYAKAVSAGNVQKAKLFQDKLSILAKYGSAYNSLSQLHELSVEQLNLLKAKLEEAKVDAYQKLPHKYVVNPAEVSEKKAKPVRWLIVVISTISGFIFSIFMLMFFEQFKLIKESLKKEQKDIKAS
jgi:uncharacterized protein involved in exopolysaccharide biosynthesis